MTGIDKRRVVAVYTRYYISLSMTFIYRQLLGVSSSFNPIVLTSSAYNLDLFPFPALYAKRKGFSGKIYARLRRMMTGSFCSVSPSQERYWRHVLVSHKASLLHAHFGTWGLDVLPLARKLGIPMIVTFHGFDASSMLRDQGYVSALKDLFEYAYVIAVSNVIAKRLQAIGAPPARVQVHYIGVPIEDFSFVERSPLREKVQREEHVEFLQVSNFVEKKGHEYTVQAFAKLLSRYPHCALTLAGDGPLREEIEALCAELSIVDHVRFTGKVAREQVVSLMEGADAFLHHSVTAADGDQEGIPTVLMEAMARGLPVVSTLHSGIPELIEDGVDGFLVEERDIDGYAEKLEQLLESDGSIGRRASRKISESFNMAVQNEKLMEIYEKVMNG